MKRVFISLVMSLLLVNFSFAVTPITEFNPGKYVGGGTWLAQDGSFGDFKTFLVLDPSGWTVAKFIFGDLFVYETELFIDANGFLNAAVIDATDPDNLAFHTGYGNCGTNYCQLTVEIDNGVMQKTMVFNDDGSIDCIGAVYYDDGTPNMQWEGSSKLLP